MLEFLPKMEEFAMLASKPRFRFLFVIAKHKDEQLFEFFKKQAIPEDSSLSMISVILGNIKLFKIHEIPDTKLFFHLCSAAGQLDIFQEAESRKLNYFGLSSITAAVHARTMEILKFILGFHLVKTPVALELPRFATHLGRLEIVKYFKENTKSMDPNRIDRGAVAGGHVHILDWMWDSGIPINFENICLRAINGKHMEPWNERNLQVLKWVRKKKGTWQLSCDLVVLATEKTDHKILRWLLFHGYVSKEDDGLGNRSEGKIDLEEFQNLKGFLD
jgi:hypothetical protein